MSKNDNRTSGHDGLDIAGDSRSLSGGGECASQLRQQGAKTAFAGWCSGGRDGLIRDRDEFFDLAFSAPGNPWGEHARTRIDRPEWSNSPHRITASHTLCIADSQQRRKGMRPDPVLVGSLIASSIAVIALFITGLLI